MSFVHLHTHTQYSLLDGSNKIAEYVARVKELGMTAAAITDHGVMYGAVDFYRECKKAGINPVIGSEVYVANGSRFDRETKDSSERYYHLILLAENDQGYSNLMKIVSIGFVDGFYYKPRVDFETLEKYHEGLICLSACLAGEVPRKILRGDLEGALETAKRYRDCFGEGNYFLEMQNHGYPDQQRVNAALMNISQEAGIGLVATNDCHYTFKEDADAHDVLICIQTGKRLADEDRMRYEGGQFYVKSPQEMEELFSFAPQAINNTQMIADRCHVEIVFGQSRLPKYDLPPGEDAFEYLTSICTEGIKRRYGENILQEDDKIKSRLDYELNLIKEMGFVDYFLIVWDFINYAKKNGIPVGPGRGSAAGSIVAYSSGITDIDPIKYDLLFERFLNPERVSMPDIDVDFCPERRGEVIDYVVSKYGKEQVSQIITFGSLKAKAVIRDVGRVMDLPYGFVSQIADAIPAELNITIEGALGKNPQLRQMYEENGDVKKLIDFGKRLEGLPRHSSMHAAGVVIASQPIVEYVPLARASDDQIVTEFTMTTLEELGLLKMDFLGLRNLTVIDNCIKLVERIHGVKIDFDTMDFDDRDVYELISSGKNEGVFQLESAGMTSFMTELKPENIEDIIAGIALYRPGPMDFIPRYIRGKNNRDSIKYDTPLLEPILKNTYGCIVYQEQVMQIVRSLAGYSLGRSDLLRRAMSKKKQDVMTQEKEVFLHGDEEAGVPGCVKNGIHETVASKIYDDMLDFAKYAFNKSHAASYAVISYQTAYLKSHYPAEFYAALLSSDINNTAKVSKYISSCREMGIEVLPSDVNSSMGDFTVNEGKIVYGMYAIKSVGIGACDSIVEERKRGGSYKSLEDFIQRLLGVKSDQGKAFINKKAMESLILAGALDSLPGNRRQKMAVYSIVMDRVAKKTKNDMAGQMSLFDLASEEDKKSFEMQFPQMEEYTKDELLANEKAVLGIYVSGHPLDDYKKLMEESITATADMFAPARDDEEGEEVMENTDSSDKLNDNSTYILGGMINEVNVTYTKKGQPMAFLTLEDLTGTMEVIVFPNTYDKVRERLKEDGKVFVKGRANLDGERGAKLICQELIGFEELPKRLFLRFKNMEDFEAGKEDLFIAAAENPGGDAVIIYLEEEKQKKQLKKTINAGEAVLDYLSDRYGSSNVGVKRDKFR